MRFPVFTLCTKLMEKVVMRLLPAPPPPFPPPREVRISLITNKFVRPSDTWWDSKT